MRHRLLLLILALVVHKTEFRALKWEDEPWTGYLETFEKVLNKIRENKGEKDSKDEADLQMLRSFMQQDCDDKMVSELTGPDAIHSVGGIETRTYVLTEPEDEETTFCWTLPASVDCTLTVERPVTRRRASPPYIGGETIEPPEEDDWTIALRIQKEENERKAKQEREDLDLAEQLEAEEKHHSKLSQHDADLATTVLDNDAERIKKQIESDRALALLLQEEEMRNAGLIDKAKEEKESKSKDEDDAKKTQEEKDLAYAKELARQFWEEDKKHMETANVGVTKKTPH